MPYIGNTIRAADDYRLIDDISSGFNGSETSFALQVAGSAPVPFPKSPQQVLISVNGVIQEPDPTGSSGFNLVGTNIVFSSAPTNGHAFFGIIYATADYLNAGGNFPAGSLGAPSITFIGDENTGLFRKSGGSVGFVSDATEIANFDSNGITISSGNIIIPDSIIHNGDTNTKIRFPAADTVSVETAGSERLRITSAGLVLVGHDADKSGGDTNALLQLFTPTAAKLLLGRSDTSISSGNFLGIIDFHGTDGTSSQRGARIGAVASGDHGTDDKPTDLVFQTTADGAGSSTERMRITSDGRLGLGLTPNTSAVATNVSAGLFQTDGNIDIRYAGTNSDPAGARYLNFINTDTTLVNEQPMGGIHWIGNDTSNPNNINCSFTALNSGSGGGSGMFIFKTAGSERFRISPTGNVGIGTTSPAYNLDISNASGEGQLRIDSSAGNHGMIRFSQGGTNKSYIQHVNGNDLAFGPGGSEKVRIDSSGRLLIGTTTNTFTSVGSSRLQVSGTGADTAGINLIRTSNDGGGAYLQFTKNRGSATQSGDTCGGISWMGHDGTDVESYLAQIRVLAGATATSNAMTGDILFETANSSSVTTERMRIANDGKVGIGDSTPNYELQVNDPSGTVSVVQLTNTTTGAGAGDGLLMYITGNDTIISNEESGYMRFQTSGLERMRIDSSGNMLLGLTSTSFPKRLNVQGSSGAIIALKNNDTTSYAANTNTSIEFGLNTGNTGNQNGSCEIRAFKENGTNGNNARGLSFYTGGNGGSPTERMRINSSGRVLIKCEDFTNDPSSSNRGVMIGDTSSGTIFSSGSATGTQTHLIFRNGNGDVGLVQTSGSSTSYNTSSDYRLKENAVAISDGITRLKTLKPYRFNFKTDPSTTVDGFFAHEVTAVPEAISGTKDEVALADDKDKNLKRGDPIYQGIDQSKLVPLLVAAVKELITKVETLEAA